MKRILNLFIFILICGVINIAYANTKVNDELQGYIGKSVWYKKLGGYTYFLSKSLDHLEQVVISNIQQRGDIIYIYFQRDSGEISTMIENISAPKTAGIYLITRAFYTENPYEKFDWDDSIWNIIKSQQVNIGFNKEQCRFSWGDPLKVNKTVYSWGTNEQWVYGNGNYLYFENDNLTAIQKF